MSQTPHAVVMVRQSRFVPNPETAVDNAFQHDAEVPYDEVSRRAYADVTRAAEKLAAHGVTVHLFDDDDPSRPDSVFPNNWFSTHSDGSIAVYPMHAPNRRLERRWDILALLAREYRVTSVTDYSPFERSGRFLEGTGAMVLDHGRRLAYTCRSLRADPRLLARFCTDFGYEPYLVDATDRHGVPIYHTNVMMALGTSVAVVGLELVRDDAARAQLRASIEEDGAREIVELSERQIGAFAGNALEVMAGDHRALVMSSTAVASLESEQKRQIERHVELIDIDVPTIEVAGGSIRCMLAGVHLPQASASSAAS